MEIIIKDDEFSIKKSKNNVIKNINDPITKTFNLSNYSGMLSEIYIQNVPKYLDKIVITAGEQRVFVWNKNEIEEYVQNHKNILSKYKLNKTIPLSNTSYHSFKLHFVYNNTLIYKDCIIEKEEYIEKIASEDTSKLVEYWDMDDECVCQAYGVKYEEITKTREIIMSAPKLNTSEFKLILVNNNVAKNENYEIEFYDDNLGKMNYLRYNNSMYGVAYMF